MQVRKWLNWGSKSTSDGDYPHPETTSPEALSRNPETPESAAEFLNGLDLDLMRDWAKQLYMRAKKRDPRGGRSRSPPARLRWIRRTENPND